MIEYRDKTFNFPRKLLPLNAKEGDVLKFDIAIYIEETEKRKKNIQELINDLFTEE
ncbi:Protein of unknown function [Thermoanaerobacter thermohydrosulfuricus]|uniref:DUF3006 domain-containing protein n=1 Tax=Thermoanaerobacter thermohydrosulfuricus TaxID=1516 RepID=A0A1G7WPC8_THETY|nr:Protein of unknown function [Thermoanaerobacter thermohydrosulfuricus]